MPWQSRPVTFTRPHRVAFTHDAFHPDNPTLAQAFAPDQAPGDSDIAPRVAAHRSARTLLVLDQNLAASNPQLLSRIHRRFAHDDIPALAATVHLPGGEETKNHRGHLDTLHAAMLSHGIDRRSYILALGGGALLDTVGYAAATCHRGVRLIRLPSTTLAQCDSGVGVKNAVNRHGIKNAVGTFAVPFAVVNDFDLLGTLPDDVWRHGFAECIKVALLKDAPFFRWLEANQKALADRNETVAQYAWQRSAELHFDHITEAGDPFEERQARPLDLGHWAAHRLEELSHHHVSHGHAVALGLAVDLTYARRIGLLPRAVADRGIALLDTLGLPTHHPLLAHPNLPGGLEAFRQHLGGRLTVTTIRDVADPVDLHAFDEGTLHQTLHDLATPSPQTLPVGPQVAP